MMANCLEQWLNITLGENRIKMYEIYSTRISLTIVQGQLSSNHQKEKKIALAVDGSNEAILM